MAAESRIRGQETSVLIVRDGALEASLVDVRNFNFAHQLEIQSQGYLGEKSERKDEIYKGVKGSMELHLHNQEFIAFEQAILDRAQRNTPDVIFNITSVLSFPNGQTPTFLFADVKFGEIPHDFPDRAEYVSVKLDFECERAIATSS